MSGGKHRVLIADDFGDTLTMLKYLICNSEETCCEGAQHGLEAIKKYDEARREGKPFDVLILDAQMPQATGFEVADHVRKEVGDERTPIIIITGLHETMVKPHAKYSKATDVWYKPFDPAKFKARVNSLLNGDDRSKWATSGVEL